MIADTVGWHNFEFIFDSCKFNENMQLKMVLTIAYDLIFDFWFKNFVIRFLVFEKLCNIENL
ncbi:hypothetical protein DMB65_00690 [Flavobacterium cheongpyeongense]|uniref:Uncharacterized protein n=1 Tax=Flavobacterium cheongpyeongense TaxID=2212651 RepID=A0A2V4BU73_9FLAO|nr:hypothetical protein DMB65_00690 [Flavobacterium cheongpyeongense]